MGTSVIQNVGQDEEMGVKCVADSHKAARIVRTDENVRQSQIAASALIAHWARLVLSLRFQLQRQPGAKGRGR